MKRIFFILLFIPLTFFGQNNKNLIIDLGIYQTQYESMVFDVIPQFKPIGWNESGYFAYQITKCDDMCGCCIDYICIRSIITDKVIDSQIFGENGNGRVPYDISYKDSTNKVNLLLAKYKIQQTGLGELIKLNKINEYDIILKENNITNDKRYGFGRVTRYIMLAGNDKIGFKKVSEGLIEDASDELNYIGYFKDPFENRILILFSSSSTGSAETNWHTLHFVGCNLERNTF